MNSRPGVLKAILISLLAGALFFLILYLIKPSEGFQLLVVEILGVLLLISVLYNIFHFNKKNQE